MGDWESLRAVSEICGEIRIYQNYTPKLAGGSGGKPLKHVEAVPGGVCFLLEDLEILGLLRNAEDVSFSNRYQ